MIFPPVLQLRVVDLTHRRILGVKYILGSTHHASCPQSSDEQPFQIAISEALSLLKQMLDDTRFPDEINDADWAYGAPLADIRRLTER